MDLECLQPQLFKDFNQILKSDRMNHAYLFQGILPVLILHSILLKVAFARICMKADPVGNAVNVS